MSKLFSRSVHCLAGLPIDAISLEEAARSLLDSIQLQQRCVLTTPNLNFLITSLHDPLFRISVLSSDLVIADGMPLIWLARLLNIPIRQRVAGSDLFDYLRDHPLANKIRVYLFGGPEGAAQQAAQHINQSSVGMQCCGYQAPGFVPVAEMSSVKRLQAINQARPDFLVLALGARKGQEWIMHNANALQVPVISHLGAVVNFTAGTVSRAPIWMQRSGLEWLWRVYEEPVLWKRYWHDGWRLMQLMVRLLPLAVLRRLHRPAKTCDEPMILDKALAVLRLQGNVYNPVSDKCRVILAEAMRLERDIVLDCSNCDFMDSECLGLLLLFDQLLKKNGHTLTLIQCSRSLYRLLRLNLCDFNASLR